MQTARYGGVDAGRSGETDLGALGWGMAFGGLRLRQEERDVAILTGKLPDHEQEHDRRDEITLANWLALMNL